MDLILKIYLGIKTTYIFRLPASLVLNWMNALALTLPPE